MTRTLAVTASGDFTAKLWCSTTGKELHEFKHKHVVKTVDFSADTSRIVTGCQDGLLRVYDTAVPEADPVEYRVASDLNDAVTKCLWTASENVVLIGKRSGVLELWDVRQGGIAPSVRSIISLSLPVMDIELSSSHGLLTAAAGNAITILSSSDLAVRTVIPLPEKMHFREEGGASMHPNGSKVIAGGSDLWLREFDAISGEVYRTFKGHHGPVRCVRYHPLGETVASGSEDATIRIWDLSIATDEE